MLKGNNRNGSFLYLVNILHGDKSLTGPEKLFNYTYDHFKVQFNDMKIDNLIRPKPEKEKYRMIIVNIMEIYLDDNPIDNKEEIPNRLKKSKIKVHFY